MGRPVPCALMDFGPLPLPKGNPRQMPLTRRARDLGSLLIGLIALAIAVGFLGYRLSLALGLDELQATGRHRLDLYTTSLEREIDKYAYFPATLGLERDVLELLVNPLNAELTERVDTYLEQLNQRAGPCRSMFLIATARSKWPAIGDNRTVSLARNWPTGPISRMPSPARLRPFLRDQRDKGEPGYYLSSPCSETANSLASRWSRSAWSSWRKSWDLVEAPALVADENGVVMLASVPSWKFTTLRPLDEETRRLFDSTQQYNRRGGPPLELHQTRRLNDNASLVDLPNSPTSPASDWDSQMSRFSRLWVKCRLMSASSRASRSWPLAMRSSPFPQRRENIRFVTQMLIHSPSRSRARAVSRSFFPSRAMSIKIHSAWSTAASLPIFCSSPAASQPASTILSSVFYPILAPSFPSTST